MLAARFAAASPPHSGRRSVLALAFSSQTLQRSASVQLKESRFHSNPFINAEIEGGLPFRSEFRFASRAPPMRSSSEGAVNDGDVTQLLEAVESRRVLAQALRARSLAVGSRNCPYERASPSLVMCQTCSSKRLFHSSASSGP